MVMKIKKRTLNELRQTKDCHYVNPQKSISNRKEDIIDQYIDYMKSEGRISQASLVNFKYYMERNNLSFVKTA